LSTKPFMFLKNPAFKWSSSH